MSIFIKGMDMPLNCFDCCCHDHHAGYCNILNKYCYDDAPKKCPLVEVPTPHGRLIDEENLKRELHTSNIVHHYGTQIINKIDGTPAIIEAEE